MIARLPLLISLLLIATAALENAKPKK